MVNESILNCSLSRAEGTTTRLFLSRCIKVRIAAIDVGSNSIRLLVADISDNKKIKPNITGLKTTRLGQGIIAGRLLDTVMVRTVKAVQVFVEQAKQAGAEKIVLAATSAVRDAQNREDFITMVRDTLGYDLWVLSGDMEAQLSYLGVTGAFGDMRNAAVVDIGGGSTEFIWCQKESIRFLSVKAGAVRMTESGYGSGQIRKVLDGVLTEIKKDNPIDVIGVGGTVTTLAAMALGMREYDPLKIHGFRLTFKKVCELYKKLVELPVEERKALLGLQPERADIIPAGTLILLRILEGIQKESLIVSEADILYGLILKTRNMS